MSSATAAEIALWMKSRVASEGELYQEEAAYEIVERFGEEHTYVNENGNLAIGKPVLDAFRRVTEGTVVWVRTERRWRVREEGDQGRLVDS